MITINELDNLYNNGVMSLLIEKGLMSSHLYSWRLIYHSYVDELKTESSKLQAMENVAIEHDVSVELVRHIRRKFK